MHKPFQPVIVHKPDLRRKENKGKLHPVTIKPYLRSPTQTPTQIQIKARELNIFHKQSDRCYWCCILLDFTQVDIEHVVPKCMGGSDDISNLRVSCRRCNGIKNMSLPMDFALYQLRAPVFIRSTRHGRHQVPIKFNQSISETRKAWLRFNGQNINP